MNVLELFSGTGSFSKAADDVGFFTWTSDYDNQFNTDYCVDILDFSTDALGFHPDIIWASPPCESFSVASIGKHWNRNYTPKSEQAVHAVKVVTKAINIINELKPKYWFIENPRGMLRKMDFMQGARRVTVTYCQYGDTRMKPTDIWTNCMSWVPRPMCKNGSPCHVASPRGSRTGTQGIKTYKDRSRVPHELCQEIIDHIRLMEVTDLATTDPDTTNAAVKSAKNSPTNISKKEGK